MKEVLQLDFNPRSVAWTGSLQARLANSASPELRKRYKSWQSVGLGELALAIATRLAISRRVVERLRESLTKLTQEVDQSGQLDTLLATSNCFQPKDKNILFDICAGIDSCIFEWRSLYEVLGTFATTFSKEILHTKISEIELVSVVRDAGIPTAWVSTLRSNRKLFFHETAPWIALEVTTRQPLRFAIVVMKENLANFEDAEKFVTEADLIEAGNGLGQSVVAVRDWLEEQIMSLEGKLNAKAG